jgi:putative FmdB family regulatory protein
MLYEYKCSNCGKTEEKLENLQAAEQHNCSFCGKADGMKRILSVSAFSLSGGGWFNEGYQKKG